MPHRTTRHSDQQKVGELFGAAPRWSPTCFLRAAKEAGERLLGRCRGDRVCACRSDNPSGKTSSKRGSVGGQMPSYIGAYELLAPLGEGGMGVVYHARHTKTGQEVALKAVKVPKAGLLRGIR